MTSVQPGTDSGAVETSTTKPQVDRPSWCPPKVWPFEIHSVNIDGNVVAYTDHGPRLNTSEPDNPPQDAGSKSTGPTLLFVHTGMWSFIFREVITRLGDDFRCVTLDVPGHGLSPEPSRPITSLDDHRRVLGRFVDTLGLDDIVPVLHDLGGPMAVAALGSRTERVRGLVLSNTFLWRPDTTALRLMLRLVSSRPMTGFDRATGLIPRASAGGGGIGRHLDRDSKRCFVDGMRQPRRTARFHHLMGDALTADDLYRDVEAATTGPLRRLPVLTIFGEKNDPFGFQDRHHRTFPRHEGHVIEGGNHFPMMDDPDFFADRVRSWISNEL